MTLTILKSGSLTTIQDTGRPGVQSLGIPPSGAMDRFALRIANRCVGNESNAACLEFTLIGPTIEFDEETTIALTGANFNTMTEHDSLPVPLNRAVHLAAGAVLKIGAAIDGARGYLSIQGGIDVPLIFGSRATYLPAAIGGYHGRRLQQGDRLVCRSVNMSKDMSSPIRCWRGAANGTLNHMQRLRVFPSSQTDFFSEKELKDFFAQVYTLRPDSDRMGIKLAGLPLTLLRPTDISSEASLPGNIQITPGGLPIILGQDCPTTGGYAKIGTVFASDFGALAYLRPGDRVMFSPSTLDAARTSSLLKTQEIDEGFAQI